jgi:hypothetical protein
MPWIIDCLVASEAAGMLADKAPILAHSCRISQTLRPAVHRPKEVIDALRLVRKS